MRRLAAIVALSGAFAGAAAAPASADLISDLTGLGLGATDVLSIDTSIGLPQAPGTGPIDMTTKWTTNPPGQPLTKKASSTASKKTRKKTRRARR